MEQRREIGGIAKMVTMMDADQHESLDEKIARFECAARQDLFANLATELEGQLCGATTTQRIARIQLAIMRAYEAGRSARK
jgi:3,4-dihydroxy-2-butanone 4-phosphate synthase